MHGLPLDPLVLDDILKFDLLLADVPRVIEDVGLWRGVVVVLLRLVLYLYLVQLQHLALVA